MALNQKTKEVLDRLAPPALVKQRVVPKKKVDAGLARIVTMYVCMLGFGGTSTRAYTRTQSRGATPELRRVADTTSHGLSAGRHSTQTTIGSPSLCGRPEGDWRLEKRVEVHLDKVNEQAHLVLGNQFAKKKFSMDFRHQCW